MSAPEYHVASLIVRAVPERLAFVRGQIEALPEAVIHAEERLSLIHI